MKIESGIKLDFQDVLIKPQPTTISSRSEVVLMRTFTFKNGQQWVGVPVMSSNMGTICTGKVWTVMTDNEMLVGVPRGIEPVNVKNGSWRNEAYVAATNSMRTFGVNDEFESTACLFVCVDAANGGMTKFLYKVQDARSYFPDKVIVAGNVATGFMAQLIASAGADIIKVGLGSGSACATREVAGVGIPQLSAILDCADIDAYIMSDGGCSTPGDIAKAFGAGADFVMLGGMLAGHNENGLAYHGLSSARANQESHGGLKNYRASEGYELALESRGKLQDTLDNIKGGLRSACAYVGASSLEELPVRTTFVQVNRILNTSLEEYKL